MGGPRGPGGVGGFTPADEERRRGVRRMKVIATGALLLMAVVFALTKLAEQAGAGAWTGYVAAAAEAGMVGALADWFAVTALFRRPMGLPIPHTAIIPTKKDQLGQSLGDFVGENFLSADVVRDRLRAVGISSRLGGWLAQPDHADRVTAELSTALRGALTVLRDSDVQAVVSEAITRRATAQEVAPGLGRMLERIVTDGGHRRVVDLVCTRAAEWLREHGDSVMGAVAGGAPGWTPKFVDRKVGERVYRELLRFVTEMRDMPDHPARGAVDRFLTDFAADLQSDPDTRARVERLKNETLARDEVQDLIASVWGAVRAMLVAAAEDERSELRIRARAALLSLGSRLASDGRLRSKVDGWIEGAAVYLVTTYRDEITSLISETIAGWDAEHTSKKIEAHIGRDLQFIRINGTVVGSLAGLAIYTVARFFGG
ncbi:DUF445 domain-containing protein [Streptomyces oryzae]|uniref:DUF445 domain-containing protein n=1 Tax=Streptomyces oryzae TaxID=1434886 RepID=A0ABS3XFJ3_9ACTN|nr:DUF445 domain-containing protein [Streptomyces oryzae]MBO8194071.1 DUF445 domain-containing protein [Streptomyces oryzae]